MLTGSSAHTLAISTKSVGRGSVFLLAEHSVHVGEHVGIGSVSKLLS